MSTGSLTAPSATSQDLVHDLVGAAADGPQAGVTGGPLDVVLDHVARAAMDLQARVHDLEGGPLSRELGNRDLAHGVLPGVEVAAQRRVRDVTSGLDLVTAISASLWRITWCLPIASWQPSGGSSLRSSARAKGLLEPATCIAPTAPSAISSRSH